MVLDQSDDMLSNLRFSELTKYLTKRYCQITFITIWLICASILTKSFTSLLLNTYFNLKYEPLFETLDDLINNRDLNIILDVNNYQKIMDRLGGNKYLIEFIERAKIYQKFPSTFLNHLEILDSQTIIEEIVNGKTVYMADGTIILLYFN